jgi:hypothetical protein
MSVWLVSVPNEGNSSSETTFLSLKAETASSRHDYAGRRSSCPAWPQPLLLSCT